MKPEDHIQIQIIIVLKLQALVFPKHYTSDIELLDSGSCHIGEKFFHENCFTL
jgi:hypothetical protein